MYTAEEIFSKQHREEYTPSSVLNFALRSASRTNYMHVDALTRHTGRKLLQHLRRNV